MPRPSRTGVHGLFKEGSRYRIDLRYVDASGAPARYQERLPLGTPGRAATLHAQQVVASALAGTLARVDSGAQATLREAFDQYLTWVATNRPRSHGNRTSIAAVWLRTVGDVPAAALGPEVVERYKKARRASGSSPATVNRGVAMVKHMAGVAARAGWPWMTRERAVELREVGTLREPPGRQRPIQSAELDAIIGAFRRADSRFARRVTAAALLTGCRLGELLSLRKGSVDLKRGTIDLSHTKQNRNHQVAVTGALAALVQESLAEPKGGGSCVFGAW
jgi:integrase